MSYLEEPVILFLGTEQQSVAEKQKEHLDYAFQVIRDTVARETRRRRSQLS